MANFEVGQTFWSPDAVLSDRDIVVLTPAIGTKDKPLPAGRLRLGIASDLAARTSPFVEGHAQLVGEESWTSIATASIGDTVRVRTTVLAVEPAADGQRLHCRRELLDQADRPVMEGMATLLVEAP